MWRDVRWAERKIVRCESDEGCFGLSYDRLVVAVGSTTNTFGTTGVAQNCLFMKEVDDGITTRTKIFEQFEKATVPLAGSADEIDAERELYAVLLERNCPPCATSNHRARSQGLVWFELTLAAAGARLLHFVVVGGGACVRQR